MPQHTWAEFEVGRDLSPMIKPAITKVQLLMYAGASGDFNLIHTDVETAHAVGLSGTIAHGMLSMGFLGEYAGELIGDQGFVQRLTVRFSGMVFPGDVLTCRARVVERDEEQRRVRLTLSAEREAGKPLTAGEVVLAFTR